MLDLSLTTELEAVNLMLAGIGESPVNQFDGQFVDAEIARKLLNQQMRSVQVQGWSWNTDYTVTIPPDVEGKINIGNTALLVVTEDPNLVQRGDYIYDRTRRAIDGFTSPVNFKKIVNLLAFEDCPESFRTYVTVKASRLFQDRMGGEQSLHTFMERDERQAWANLQNYEAEVAQLNLFDTLQLSQRMKGNRP